MKAKRYKVERDGITLYINEGMFQEYAGTISVFTENGSTAELSELGKGIEVEGLEKPIYFFNRIKCRPRIEGTGEGKALMIEVCKLADKHGITIFNPLNPYGKRDMEKLKSFFRASDFEDWKGEEGAMIRKPKRGEDEQRVTRDSETET